MSASLNPILRVASLSKIAAMLAQKKSPFHLALFLTGVYSRPTGAQEHDRQVHRYSHRISYPIARICGSETFQGKGDTFLKIA